MKTTVILRDDLYAFLVEKFGRRGISQKINEILFQALLRNEENDFFGADKWLKQKPFEREHDDRF